MNETTNSRKSINRPVFLTVLCILTFIYCGIGALSLIYQAVKGAPTPTEIEAADAEMVKTISMFREEGAGNVANMLEQMNVMESYGFQNFWLLLGINTFYTAIGITGAIMMMKGRKLGFHLYIIYSILWVVSIYAAVPVELVPSWVTITNVILSLIFILMYSRNLKWMK